MRVHEFLRSLMLFILSATIIWIAFIPTIHTELERKIFVRNDTTCVLYIRMFSGIIIYSYFIKYIIFYLKENKKQIERSQRILFKILFRILL